MAYTVTNITREIIGLEGQIILPFTTSSYEFPILTTEMIAMKKAGLIDYISLAPMLANAQHVTPRGFVWDAAALPFTTLRQAGGRVFSLVDVRRAITTTVWAAPLATAIFHVDPVGGSDTTGTGIGTYRYDFSAAVRTPQKAVTLGNATGAPYQVLIKADSNPRINRADSGVQAGIKPTQPCAFIAYGGRVRLSAFDAHTWAVDGTYGNTYSVAETNCSGVFDLLNTRIVGSSSDYQGRTKTLLAELTKVADAATCNATPGSWVNTGGKTYVRRSDGAAVTDSNTMSLRNSYGYAIGATTVYFQGFDFEGGLDANTAGTRNLICEDCTFRYGQQYSAGRGLSLDNITGVAGFVNCEADANGSDGFNFHNTSGQSFVLTIDCSAWDNGRGSSISNNGNTGHERVVGVDIGGDYRYNRGGSVRWIDQSSLWCIGTFSGYDYGDIAMGGSMSPTEFRVDSYAQMFLDDTVAQARSGGAAYSNSGLSRNAIWTRNATVLSGTISDKVYPLPT